MPSVDAWLMAMRWPIVVSATGTPASARSTRAWLASWPRAGTALRTQTRGTPGWTARTSSTVVTTVSRSTTAGRQGITATSAARAAATALCSARGAVSRTASSMPSPAAASRIRARRGGCAGRTTRGVAFAPVGPAGGGSLGIQVDDGGVEAAAEGCAGGGDGERGLARPALPGRLRR